MSKKIILVMLISFSCSIVMAQENFQQQKFLLKGEVKGRDTGILVLTYNNIKDTAILISGEFSFSGVLEGATLASLSGDVKSRSVDDANFSFIFLEPRDMEAVLTENDFNHPQIKGSNTQDEMEQYNKQREPIRNEIKFLKEERAKVDTESESPGSQTKLDSIRAKLDLCLMQLKMTQYKFVALNPDSFLSPYLMAFYREDDISLDSAKYFYQRFSSDVKNSFWGKEVAEKIQNHELTNTGNVAPEFLVRDINGKKITLTSFRGKSIVLLDFWASWCVPCRKLSPHLKKLYQKYHAKGFEIISISVDEDTTIWKNAVRKDGIQGWINIQNNDKQDLKTEYNVSAYPTIILLDKEGYIIGREIGFTGDNSESDLDQKLKEIFR